MLLTRTSRQLEEVASLHIRPCVIEVEDVGEQLFRESLRELDRGSTICTVALLHGNPSDCYSVGMCLLR